MLSNEKNRWLAEQSYWVDNKKDNKPYTPEKGEQYYYDSDNPKLGKFEVLKVKNNSDNGMQAMAVAPVDKNGKVDTTEIVIAYAGTNFSDAKDRATDLQTVVQGNKKLDLSPMHSVKGSKIDGQAISAQKFANKVKAKYSNSAITTTCCRIFHSCNNIIVSLSIEIVLLPAFVLALWLATFVTLVSGLFSTSAKVLLIVNCYYQN